MLLTELVNAPDGACERSRLESQMNVFEPGSSRIRLIQIPLKDMSSLIQYLILFEYRSNPTRNVRMQWSISLLVSTMSPSGIVICLYIFAQHFGHKKWRAICSPLILSALIIKLPYVVIVLQPQLHFYQVCHQICQLLLFSVSSYI